MNSENNKKVQDKKETKVNKKYINPFRMNILDDIYDPFDDLFGFENKMFKSFENIFNDIDLLSEKPKKEEKIPEKVEKMEEEPKEEEINTHVEEPKEEEINTHVEEPKEEEINTNIEEPKEEEINTNIEEPKEEIKTNIEEPKEEEKKPLNEGTFYSKVYYTSYNNLNGKQNQEKYQSQSIKQINNGHNISETKESYKNSDGIEKTAYQRGLDDKTTRFIKEKNIKTGKKDQHKIIKGIEENEIKDFNKEYDEFSKKFGFRKYLHDFNTFEPFKKQLNYNPNLFRLLF
jgi:hypothetical protein